jgi:threonine/homoserine/homoserine lactone efflux protein
MGWLPVGVMLLALGYGPSQRLRGWPSLWRNRKHCSPSLPGVVRAIWRGCDGALISFLNPKLAIFFIALFSQFLIKDGSMADHGIMVGTVTVVDGLWYTIVAVVLSHGRIFSALQRRSQLVNRLTGGVLILLALRVVTL